MGGNLYATLWRELRAKSLTLFRQALCFCHHGTLSDNGLLPGCLASPVCCRLALPASDIINAHLHC